MNELGKCLRCGKPAKTEENVWCSFHFTVLCEWMGEPYSVPTETFEEVEARLSE